MHPTNILLILVLAVLNLAPQVESIGYDIIHGNNNGGTDVGTGVLGTGNHESSDHPLGALGQGFYLPKEDLLSTQFTGRGVELFDTLPAHCIVEAEVAVDRKDESFYSSTKDVYQAISTETNLDLTLQSEFTMGASLRSVTNNMASSSTSVSGNSLELYTQNKDYSISQDCINEERMRRSFLKDFSRLPRKITSPWIRDSWHAYQIFFKKHGSHVVNTVLTGASIYQYAFAESDKNYSQRNFTVKACASLAGPTEVGELGLSACSGVTNQEIHAVHNMKMVSKLVIRGGTADTRANLINSRNEETIQKFLVEGKTNPSPVKYKFIPIWDILQARYIGTSLMAQARNLEEFYKGFLDYGCDYQKTANGKVLQKFLPSPHSTLEFPAFQCAVAPQGCHVDNDCHYRIGGWCACGGESCVQWRDVTLTSGDIQTQAHVLDSRDSDWGWHGCELYGFKCYCTAPSDNWEVVWQDDRERVLRNVHNTVRRRMRRAGATIRDLEDNCVKKEK